MVLETSCALEGALTLNLFVQWRCDGEEFEEVEGDLKASKTVKI